MISTMILFTHGKLYRTLHYISNTARRLQCSIYKTSEYVICRNNNAIAIILSHNGDLYSINTKYYSNYNHTIYSRLENNELVPFRCDIDIIYAYSIDIHKGATHAYVRYSCINAAIFQYSDFNRLLKWIINSGSIYVMPIRFRVNPIQKLNMQIAQYNDGFLQRLNL